MLSEYPVFSVPKLKYLGAKYDIANFDYLVNKKVYKYYKNVLKTKRALTELWDLTDRVVLFQTLYPIRYNELKQSNDEIIPVDCFMDEKLHFSVRVGNTTRTFKLSESEFLRRSEEIRKNLFNEIKKELDKLYGYFIIYENDENYYITDKNIVNGKYKVLFECKNGEVIKSNKMFEEFIHL